MDGYSNNAFEQPNGDRGQRKTFRGQVPDSLALLNDDELREDARHFARAQLGMKDGPESSEAVEKLVRAAFVARDAAIYDRVAQGDEEYASRPLQVTLSDDEKEALKNERDKLFSERNILRVTAAVCLSAFLQGLMQASLNSSSLYPELLGAASISHSSSSISTDAASNSTSTSSALPVPEQWALGGLNAVPWFSAAGLGCWLAPPVNDHFGRRGAIAMSAALILASCLASGLVPLIRGEDRRSDRWRVLIAVRVINGIGMGIKAVSTPILASETAIRFWRGSFLLAWQLWVACGLMIGLLLNLIFAATIRVDDIVLGLMLGSPAVPAVILLFVLWSCPESPRYYMRVGSKNFNPKRAYQELRKIRGKCELLALKDIYLLHKTIEEEHSMQQLPEAQQDAKEKPNATKRLSGGFLDLFTQKRLRNALISASTVALSQQLCGRTLFTSFSGGGRKTGDEQVEHVKLITALGLSFGFGAVNFFCGLPAIKTIDTLGRRKWLISTLPLMCLFMAAAAYAFPMPYDHESVTTNTVRLVATLLYRCLITFLYRPDTHMMPNHSISDDHALTPPGSLGLFSGLTLLAWVLVYFLVEETRELSLENLHDVFSVPKAEFVRHKHRRLLWLARRYLLRDTRAPEPAMDMDAMDDPWRPARAGSPLFAAPNGNYAMSTAGESTGGSSGMTASRLASTTGSGGSAVSLPRGASRDRD
ncbi:glycosyl hydrolase [Apiospora aurea]|uniref:Glycosyl hydrolase n=1 Tax=Apiospora aurea TaxID=335848 RepID=A0ABR1QMA1_9PEZI